MENNYIGIDVSKETLDVAVIQDERRNHRQVTNNGAGFEQLRRWLNKLKATNGHVCLEATGQYSDAVATDLYQAGYRVSVVNPAQVKGYAESQLRRNKTDKQDAYLLADFCRTQQPQLWTPPSPEWLELRSLVRHLADLVDARQQIANRLSAGHMAALVKAQSETQLKLLDQQIAEVKKAISDHLDHHPTLKHDKDLLTSIPGIGDLTAAKLMAECRELAHFDDVRQLVAFAGLNPQHHQSGTSVNRPSAISRRGNSTLRAALYMPAIVAKRFNPILHDFAERLAARGVLGKSQIVALMRKLLHLVFGVLKTGQPFDPHWSNPKPANP